MKVYKKTPGSFRIILYLVSNIFIYMYNFINPDPFRSNWTGFLRLHTLSFLPNIKATVTGSSKIFSFRKTTQLVQFHTS